MLATGRHRLVVIAALAGLTGAALVLRLVCARYGSLAYDEYQHMHAAFLVSQGQVPFVDFFEHHTPLFYYFAAALLPLRHPSFDTLLDARYLSLGAHLLTIAIGALWARALRGGAAAAVAVALLAGNVCLFTWGTRSYLDTYAAPLLLLSAWLLPVRPGHPLRCFASAALLGLAVLVTQKAVMAGFAPAAVFALALARSRQRGAVARDVAAYAVGGLAPLLLLPALLGTAGIAGMLRDAVLLNLHWKARHVPSFELKVLFASDGFVYAAAALGVAACVRRMVRRGFALASDDVPDLFLLALCAGILLTPVVWEEYFILLLPFAVLVAARTMLEWWRTWLCPAAVGDDRQRRVGAALVGLFVALSAVDFVGLRYLSTNPISRTAFFAIPMLWMVAVAAIRRARRGGAAWEGAAWLALVLALPVVQQVDWVPRHPNDADRARVEYVMAHTAPTDPVFDGRSGYGVFRPHAYTYWFLHDEMQLMLTDAERSTDIIRALEAQRVPIAIVDDFTRLLPPPVLDYLATHYEDTPFPDIKRRIDSTRPAVPDDGGDRS